MIKLSTVRPPLSTATLTHAHHVAAQNPPLPVTGVNQISLSLSLSLSLSRLQLGCNTLQVVEHKLARFVHC